MIALSDNGLSDMYEYSKDARLYQFLEFPPHRTLDDTKQYLEKLKNRSTSGTGYYWFVQLLSSSKLIGTFGVHSIDWRKQAAEIGYGIAPAYWHRGYFDEALQLVLEHLFESLGFHRVTATTAYDNVASIKALERRGFVKEGVLRDFYLSYQGKRYDAVLMSLLKPEYEGFCSRIGRGGEGKLL